MAQKKLLFHRNLFVSQKTKPRKAISHSQLKLSSVERASELGSEYKTIDVRIDDQKMILDIERGGWKLDEAPISPEDMAVLEKKKRELEEDNNILRAKLDILLEMLAETIAEEQLQEQVDV